MRYFAGLEVSLEESAICVVDETFRGVPASTALSRAPVGAVLGRR
jgi:hypothetical protein